MSNQKWRDDSFMNRLRIFLKQKGDLEVEDIIQIKQNVFKIYGNNNWWIVKCFYDHNMQKLWSLFEKIPSETGFVTFAPFPNGKLWIEDLRDQKWCLMPFIEGEKLSFYNEQDRIQAIEILSKFHKDAKGLKIRTYNKRTFVEKLEQRYRRFTQTKHIFTRMGLALLYKKMDKELIGMLQKVKKLNWEKLEQKAKRRKTIIHGDSASHNFIRNGEDVYLIDFDLVQYAPYEYEWIQLAQRFLFEGFDSYDQLSSYSIFQDLMDNNYFKYGVMFPSDLLREWLHFLKRAESEYELKQYMQHFEVKWNQRSRYLSNHQNNDIMFYYGKKEGTNPMKDQIENLTNWLRQQVEDAGVNGLVVGLSGGIDSAVVAHLIKRAFPEQSLGLIMPCKSNSDDAKHAQMVVESSGIKSMTVDLTETHEVLFETIIKNTSEWNEEQEKLADANLRARLRMSTLYTVATNYKYLVVGTDNAAEWHTGYFTKFGDGGVDLVPLINFTKGEVRELARELGVPNEIIEKAPSAGLWEGQTDENEMGTTYDMIDRYVRGEEVPEKDKQIIERMHKNTAHKREIPKSPPKF